MNTSPPYLRVGPVAIHIHSRETNHEPASLLTEYSFAKPTLDVKGSVFLSPDDGTSIEELNGVVSLNASSSTFVSPVPSFSPSPPTAAFTPYPSTSSLAINADDLPSLQGSAPSPSNVTSEPNAQRSSTPGSRASPSPTPLSTFPQETKSYPPSSTLKTGSVAASLSSPRADPQPTILAGSTTAVLSDSSLVESMGATSASSLGPASPTVASGNFTASRNTTAIIVGSILAAILGVALILAVITWFLRVRSRRRSEDELSWDPEPNARHISDNDSFFDTPPFQVGRGRVSPPARPRPPGPNVMPQSEFSEPQIIQAPYSRLATPELAHLNGPLTVTNLMPGDVPLSTNTSIFIGSRPGSTQATPRIDNSTPRFTRLQDGGLPVPWSHSTPETSRGPIGRPKAWSRLSAASLKKVFSPSPPKSTQIDPLQPRTSATNLRTHFNNTGTNNLRFPEPARTADQTWSGTIRTGITNALSAVIGTSTRPQDPPDSNLTPIPPRPNRRLSSKTGISTLRSMSTTSTRSVGIDYTMEEKRTSRGAVHIYPLGRPQEARSFSETIKEEETEDESGFPSPDSLPSRNVPASEPMIKQTHFSQIPRVPDDIVGRPSSLPRLPTIHPLSRGWTLRSEGFITLPESDDGYRSAFNQMINERKREYDRRLAELEAIGAEEASRPVMSRASTTSLMTESTALSRESSFMDDEERKAKKVLRMRRKRAMALSAIRMGNRKHVESGASMRKPG